MSVELQKGAPIPDSLGAVVDEYRRVSEIRLLMQKETDAVKERESELRNHLIDMIPKSDLTGVAGKKYRAQIVTKEVPKADDWKALHDYIAKTGRFDLLQKRLADKAVKDMWEAGQDVPGVSEFNQVDVSVTKI